MTNHSILFRTFLLSFTFLGALCSRLELLPDSSEVVKMLDDEGLAITCLRNNVTQKLHWKTGKNVISSGFKNRIHADENQMGLALLFRKFEPSDAGVYRCEDVLDTRQHTSFTLILHEGMTFKDTPLEQNFTAGEKMVTVRCEASGTPTPVINWSGKEGILTLPKYQPVADGLVIRDISPEDAGRYSCLAIQPGYNQFVAANISVNVLYRPRWNSTDVPNVIFRTKSKKAVLSCAAQAYPKPVFRWFFRDTKIESESEVIAAEDGIYRCEVENSQGAIARNFTVHEGYLPGRPEKPKARNTTVNTVTLDFTPPKPSKHHNVTGYHIELRDKNTSNQKQVKLSDGPPFIINGLRPGTTYVIRLKAENELGYGDYSIEFEAKTSKAPISFTVSCLVFLFSVTILFFF